MSTPLNALIVEDSPDDAELLAAELQNAGFELQWRRVECETEYLANLNSELDVIFSDFSLPRFSTSRALDLLRESKLDIPFIIVSGTIGEVRAVESMKAGATDYVLKDHLERLVPVLKRALREIQERVQRKQLEAQMTEAQKMEVVGHLASGVAHDFNNILAVIIGYTSLLLPALAADTMPRKCVEEIGHAAERAVALTRQLLLFSRKQAVQRVVLDLNDAVEGMDKMLCRLIGENVELTVALGNPLGRIKADSGQVGQVLMNLVVNARDAMPGGGKLRIETADVSLNESEAAAQPGAKPGEYVVLSITDSGTGMSDSVKARVFEPLFTTKPAGKGTGLGLTTCRTIVQQSDGHIQVRSEIGKGTTINVYFPRVDEPLNVAAGLAKEGPLPRGTETLLFVEDDPSVRQLARGILETQGYRVIVALNGREALHLVDAHTGSPIRLVITDVMMPVMGGKVMAEWLRATYPDIKILFTSGYTDEDKGLAGELETGTAFLPKPYTPAAIARKVREMLDSPQVQAGT